MSIVETKTEDLQQLSGAEIENVSGGLFWLVVAAVAIVAAESCVRDKRAH